MKETRPIHLDVKLEGIDVLRFIFRMLYVKNPLILVIFGLLFPMLSLLVIQSFFIGDANKVSAFAYLPIIALGLVLFFIVFILISSKKNARQIHLVFTEEEIEVIAPNLTSQISWENYTKIQETKRDFLFFSTLQSRSFSIPKRFFESEWQMQNFKTLVREKLGDKAKLNND